MKHIGIPFLACLLNACSGPAPNDTVESLLANPVRLREVQRLCKENHTKMGDVECTAAAEAFRKGFMGDGKGHYTPSPQ